jgi:hypothetical protein
MNHYRRAPNTEGIGVEAAASGIDGMVRGVIAVGGEDSGESPAGRSQPTRLDRPRVRMHAAMRPMVGDFKGAPRW